MKRFLLAASVALLLSSTGAFASPWQGGGHGRGDHDRSWQGDNDRGDRDDHRGDRDYRRGDRDDRDWRDRGYHDNGRHLGWYKHGYRRGDRAPVVYLQPRYYVNDYRAYRLAPPPRGYRWVRPMDGHYLLVAIATGVIVDALGY
jgi:Ni/Co efflux regulator RcnB